MRSNRKAVVMHKRRLQLEVVYYLYQGPAVVEARQNVRYSVQLFMSGSHGSGESAGNATEFGIG